MQGIKQLIRNSLIYNLGNLLPVLINVLLIPVYARVLSPSDYGIVSIAETIIRILVILATMGTANAVVRFYFDFKDDPAQLKRYFGSIVSIVVGVGAILTAALLWQGESVLGIFIRDLGNIFDPYLKLAIWVAFISTLPPLLFSLYRAQNRALTVIALQSVSFLLNGGLVVYFTVFAHEGALGVLKGYLIASIATLLVAAPFFIRNTKIGIDRKMLSPLLRFSLPLVPGALAAWLMTFIDRIIINNMLEISDVGIYTIGYSAGMAMYLVVLGIQRAWVPYFFGHADADNAPSIFAKLTKYYLIIIALIGLVGSLFSKELLSWLISTDYSQSIPVVAPVILGYIFHGLYLMSVTPIFYKKKTSVSAWFYPVAAILNIVLNILWIPLWGIVGAALATTVSFILLFLITLISAQRLYYIPYRYWEFIIILSTALILYGVGHIYWSENIWLKMMTILIYPIILYICRCIKIQEIAKVRKLV